MTVKTITSKQSKYHLNKGKFNKELVLYDIRKTIRKRCKSTVTNGQINKMWKDYVNHKIILPVLKGQKVEIAKGIFIEVIGRKEIGTKLFELKLHGLQRTRSGLIKKADNLGQKRKGEVYKITYRDKGIEFPVYFTPHRNFSKRLHETLENTNNLYRFEKD